MIYELLKDRIINGGSGSEAIIQSLSISANGVYTASSGVDGYSPITVNVPQEEPNIQNLAISANGTYTAPADIDGYNPITVAVPERVPVVESKEIIENGTYTPAEGVDGFNSVVVNVPQKEPNIQNLSITTNGTYTAPSGTDGYSPVVVDVQPNLEDITITANGTYSHTGKDGYDQVVVNVPQQGITELTLSVTSLSGLDRRNIWNSVINQLTDIQFNSNMYFTSVELNRVFEESSELYNLSHLTIHIAGKTINNINGMFYKCANLRQLPIIEVNEFQQLGDEYNKVQFSSMFEGCEKLTQIPYNYLSQLHSPVYSTPPNIGNCSKMFSGCYKLRALPDLKFMNNTTMGVSTSSFTADYYVGSSTSLKNCYCLDEVTDLPLPANIGSASNNNMFGSYNLYRIKNFTFMKVDGQVQSRASFHNQNINLQNCGYAPSGTNLDSYLERYEQSAKVSTLEDYNRLKTDPDWWTDNADFSRYNYTSAKNTIESLPRDENDSDWGTLALKRYAGQGYGKCPNDLTNEELAVATRKGWTVALSTT